MLSQIDHVTTSDLREIMVEVGLKKEQMKNRKPHILKYTDKCECIREEKRVDITEPCIWEGFPLGGRFLYALCCKSPCITDNNSKLLYTEECEAFVTEIDDTLAGYYVKGESNAA